MATIATLAVSLTARTKKFEKGFNRASRRITKFARHVGKSMIMVGATAAAGLGVATKFAADFETQMAKVSTMLTSMGMTHMPRLTAAIRTMAVEMGQSTKSLTDGLYDILSAQIDVAGSTGVLAAAAKAGVAGMSDTATATKAIVTLLKSYKREASEAASMSDLLFSVIWRGRGTFEDFAPAIGNVAAIAANTGLSMEEMGAALATMTRAGVETTRASTALRSMLMAILKPTNEAKEAARGLGFELNTETLRAEGLVGIIDRLARGNAELTAKIIPQRRALLGLMAILQDVEGYHEDVAVMTERAGRTSDAFAKASNTLNFELGRMREIAKGLAVDIGEMLVPALKNTSTAMVENATAIRAHFIMAFTEIGIEGMRYFTMLQTKGDQLATGFKIVANRIEEAFRNALAFVGEKFVELIREMQEGLNVLIRAFNKLPKVNIPEIILYDPDWTDKLRKSAKEYGDYADKLNKELYDRRTKREADFAAWAKRVRDRVTDAWLESLTVPTGGGAGGGPGGGGGDDGAGKLAMQVATPAALERGTAAAFSAGVKPIFQTMAKNTAKMLEELKKVNEKLETGNQREEQNDDPILIGMTG